MEELLKGKRKVRLSDLYGKLLDGSINGDEKLIVARILKDLAIRESIKISAIIYVGDVYVDLGEKEDRINF